MAFGGRDKEVGSGQQDRLARSFWLQEKSFVKLPASMVVL